MKISRKTIALITSLIIVLSALFVISFSTNPLSDTNQAKVGEPTPTPVAQTTISLSPNPLRLSSAGEGIVDVLMDTSENEVTAVQIEIMYDPEAISNVSIKPGSFFASPVPLLNTIDKTDGRISYALAITPAQVPLKGSGTIATLVFTKNPLTTLTQTELKLLPRTLVAAKGIGPSVLKKTTGTTIIFSPQ